MTPAPRSLAGREAARRAFLAELEAAQAAHAAREAPLADPLLEAWRAFLARWDPWEGFATLTFRRDVPPEKAARTFARWVRWIEERHLRSPIRWVVAEERTQAGRIHLHALLGGRAWRMARRLSCMDAWERLPSAGFARLEVPREGASVRAYVTKYVAKGGEITLDPTLGADPAAPYLPQIHAEAAPRPTPRARRLRRLPTVPARAGGASRA